MRRAAVIAIALGSCVWVLLDDFDVGWIQSRRDVDTYYWAGEVVRAGGEPVLLYFGDPVDVWPYMYPPAFAAGWAVLSMSTRRVAYLVWAMVLLGAATALVWMVSERGEWWYALALVPYLVMMTRAGQAEGIMVVLVIAFLRLMRAGRSVRAGLAISTGLHVKLYPGLALPALAIGRRWKVFRWALLWTLAIVILPLSWVVPMAGPRGAGHFLLAHLVYPYRLLVQPAWGTSWGAFVPWWIAALVLLVMLTGAYWVAARGDPDGSIRLGVIAGVLCSPVFFAYSALVMAVLLPRIGGPLGQVAVGVLGMAGALGLALGRPATALIPVVCFLLWGIGWYQLTADARDTAARGP